MSDEKFWRGEYREVLSRLKEAEAELADLRASSVAYKVRCETCFGHGFWTSEVEGAEDITCLDCDNGWRLAEGVVRNEYRDGFGEPWYEIPARLVEGASDDA